VSQGNKPKAPSLPPPRSRTFTLPDDGSVEAARLVSSGADPDETKPPGSLPPPASDSDLAFDDLLAGSALELADANAVSSSPAEHQDFPEGHDLGIEVELGDEEAPERPTEPAPPDYEASAQRAVDGTIPLTALSASTAGEALRAAPPATTAMTDLMAVGDFTGAFDLAEARLRTYPNDTETLAVRDRCKETLEQMYSARLGSLDRVPVVNMPVEQLRWMSIDQRAAFLLHHIDGMSTLEMILDVSGMPTLDAMRLLSELMQQRVITFR
jgi:hypothetical protein